MKLFAPSTLLLSFFLLHYFFFFSVSTPIDMKSISPSVYYVTLSVIAFASLIGIYTLVNLLRLICFSRQTGPWQVRVFSLSLPCPCRFDPRFFLSRISFWIKSPTCGKNENLALCFTFLFSYDSFSCTHRELESYSILVFYNANNV